LKILWQFNLLADGVVFEKDKIKKLEEVGKNE